MDNSSVGVAASAAGNDVFDIDPDTVDIKTRFVLLKGRSRVCAMCYHAATDSATRIDKLTSKKNPTQIFILPTHPHTSETRHTVECSGPNFGAEKNRYRDRIELIYGTISNTINSGSAMAAAHHLTKKSFNQIFAGLQAGILNYCCTKASFLSESVFSSISKAWKYWRYVSIYGGVLSLFVKFSRSKKIKFVKFHVCIWYTKSRKHRR